MDRVTRFDVGKATKAARTDAGFLKVPASIARVGVLSYAQKDGSVRRELCLPEEVFHADSLASLEQMPVTLEHPATANGLLDASTTKQFAVGAVGERIEKDGERIKTNLMIHDAKAIKEIEGGRQQVSAGYTTRLEFAPGVHPEFGPYDAIQRDRRYNHVAITRAGRAGPSVRLHLDSDAAEVSEQRGFLVMEKLKIAGVEFEAPAQTAQAVAAEFARKDSEAAAQKARADSAEAALATEKQARKDSEDPAKFRAAVDARLSLERKAAGVLGAAVKLDTLSDQEIMAQVIAKANPAMSDKLKDASADYVKAAFDFATANFKPEPSKKVAEVRSDNGKGEVKGDAQTAREQMIERNRNAWQQPQGAAAAK